MQMCTLTLDVEWSGINVVDIFFSPIELLATYIHTPAALHYV